MLRLLFCSPVLLFAFVGCGTKTATNKALPPDERLKKFESRINQARKALKAGEVPDFEDIERLATQYSVSVKGAPNEATANKLVEKARELVKKANAKASVDALKKDFAEVEQMFDSLKTGS